VKLLRNSQIGRQVAENGQFFEYSFNKSIDAREVWCEHCNYIPDPYVDNPHNCFKRHMKRIHPEIFYLAKEYVIQEEADDLVFA
jgi:hypothetical protein